MRSSIIAASVLSLASAHSWITAPRAHNSQGGRGNLVGPCDQYKGSGAQGNQVTAGQRINTKWPPMGHSGGHIRVAIAKEVTANNGAGDPADQARFNEGVMETMCYGGGQCGTCVGNGKPYNKDITIPTNLEDGTYTIQFWMYGTGNGLPPYFSCTKVTISGGDPTQNCPVQEAPFETCWACPQCLPSKFPDVAASKAGQFCYEKPVDAPKCWIREPTGCDGVDPKFIPVVPMDWFHDWSGPASDKTSCLARKGYFDIYCARTDTQVSWSIDPGTDYDAPVEQHDPTRPGEQMTCMVEHVGKAGDTLAGIGRAYGVTGDVIMEATGVEDDEYCKDFRLAACPSGCDMRGSECLDDDPCTCTGDKKCRGYLEQCPVEGGHKFYVPLSGDICTAEDLTGSAVQAGQSATLVAGVAAALLIIA